MVSDNENEDLDDQIDESTQTDSND